MLFSGESVNIVCSRVTDPAFNLAFEEVFLCRRREPFILLWRNSPSVIIGRNQNAYAELDTRYTRENNIPVIRRLTGGGAVFHDLGNLNFTFIKSGNGGMADFREYLAPVMAYLKTLGLDAEFSGRNDILLEGKKISGSAQVSRGSRTMLHGTLLFSASLDVLARVLKPNPLKLESKGIRSVSSRVTNISAHLERQMSVTEFADGLFDFLIASEGCREQLLSETDVSEINALADEKYRTAHWNFGSSPAYSIGCERLFPCGAVALTFSVRNGQIESPKISGDFFGNGDISDLERALCGVEHEPSAVLEALEAEDVGDFIFGIDTKELASMFFD